MNRRKAVFLDRDGTLIIDKIYLNDPEAIEYLPGAFEALRALRDAGYVFLIATNQSGVARGIVQINNLFAIHRKMKADFASAGVDLLDFYYAPYMTNTDHWMRKPNPGMIEMGAREYGVDLTQSWMVGDRMSDVEAGHRAGTQTVLLLGQDPPEHFPHWRPPEVIATTLFEAVPQMLSRS